MRLTICIALQCCDEVCIIIRGFFEILRAGLLGTHAAKPDVRKESNRVNSMPASLRHLFVCVTFHWEVASLVFLRQVKFPALISICLLPDQHHAVITHKPWQSMLISAVLTEAVSWQTEHHCVVFKTVAGEVGLLMVINHLTTVIHWAGAQEHAALPNFNGCSGDHKSAPAPEISHAFLGHTRKCLQPQRTPESPLRACLCPPRLHEGSFRED